MRPVDWDSSQDPNEYMQALIDWENTRDQLIAEQDTAAANLVAAQARLSTIAGWVTALQQDAAAAATHANQLAANIAERATVDAALPDVQDRITDHHGAREVATARLIAGPATEMPLVLLPLRLQTRWLDGTLHVRIYPDDVSVDAHDPTLTDDETAWAALFWRVQADPTAGDLDETWLQLVRRFGASRAAWLVEASRPGQPAPVPREGPWPRPALTRLLPDRFAVLTLSGGVPINVAAAGAPPRFVTWTEPVTADLTLTSIDVDPADTPWWRDLATARAAGMAVAIPVPAGTPAIDTLVVVGVRGPRAADPATAGLSALLAAHAVSSGVALLPAGTPTNNSAELRSAYSPQAQEQAARSVRDGVLQAPPAPAAGTAAARLARALGVPGTALATLDGAGAGAAATTDAARLVVGLGAQGALRRQLGPAGDGLWALLEPGGPAPTLRIGRQPYGVLPATAPGSWRPRGGEASAGVVDALATWAAATGPQVRTDPAAPPHRLGGGPARRVGVDDDSELATLLLESASSLRWTADGTDVDGLDALVGSSTGDMLNLVAATAVADLASLPAAIRTGSLLARIAIAAKRAAPAGQVGAVNAALHTLAAADRVDVARLVAEFLDAASHRFDAWVTAAATERLGALRQAHPGEVAVGAYGWLTEVAPRVLPRSFGHVHAPSLAQASTAAVLRSAYLGERRSAWTAVVEQAQTQVDTLQQALDDLVPGDVTPQQRQQLLAQLAAAQQALAQARDHRDHLVPLPPEAERRLSMAVDLSSQRVRSALWVLAAVRAGQSLGAVLGYQFERDLAAAGLLRFMSAFRKLTRFRTGTALEAAELALEAREDELAAARAALASRQQVAADLARALQGARAAEQAAQDRQARAVAAYQPYQQMEADRAAAAITVAQLTALVAASRPRPAQHTFQIRIP